MSEDGGRGAGGRARAELSRDVWWNVGALGVAGGLGIILNVLVSAVYGTAALGVFNQVFAVYVLFSQVAALGVHYSVLNQVAASDDGRTRRDITSAALLVTAAVAAVLAAALWLAADPIGRVLGSAAVARGIRWAAPGVWFFALSKVTLACLNALERMRWYAVLFGGRFVAMVIAFGALAALGVDGALLPAIITVAEAVTFLVSLGPVRRQLGPVAREPLARWTGAHLRFGLKGFSSGLLAELNARVDVLILGAFASDALVGAYSFAAILAEGMGQLLVVVRTNFAPILIRLWADRRTVDLAATARRLRNRTYLLALPIGALAVTAYAIAIRWVSSDPELLASWKYFALLAAGLVATAGYAPLQQLLLQANLPGWHTLLLLAIVALNAAGNLLLIPALGALGSALATALALVLGVLLLRAMIRRLVGLHL